MDEIQVIYRHFLRPNLIVQFFSSTFGFQVLLAIEGNF